jgi:CelD/BcsL family acetyltransferase involved in cellulose biosynthesis
VDTWRVEVVRDSDAWPALESEWDDLYARSSAAPPFVCHAWLASWWRCYGRPGALVLVLLRRQGRLVAAAALMRRRRMGLPVLVPVGEVTSDLSDVLIDDEHADDAAPRLARALRSAAGRRALDLGELPAQAAAWRVVGEWPGDVRQSRGALCLELPGQTMADLLASLPSKTARRARTKGRAIDAAGVVVRWLEPAEAPRGIADLLALHREQWRGRAMNPEHGTERFAAHLATAATAMLARGQAAIVEYRLDGQLVRVDLLVIGHRFVGCYLYGIRPSLRQRVDATQLMLSHSLELTHRLGRPTFTYLRGDEPHKRVWRPIERPNHRVVLVGRSWVAARVYGAAVRLRARLATTVHSRLPRLRPAIARIRTWLPFSM